jgi:hypothetical protein
MHFQKDMKWGYEHGQWVMGVKTPLEFIRAWDAFILDGLQDKIACPVLNVIGADEISQTSLRVINLIRNWLGEMDVQYHFFNKESGGSAHCQIGNMSLAQAVIEGDRHYLPALRDFDIASLRPDYQEGRLQT